MLAMQERGLENRRSEPTHKKAKQAGMVMYLQPQHLEEVDSQERAN